MLKVLVAIVAAGVLQVHAQGYPNRPVHVVISFPPGSSTDIVGRIVMQKVSELMRPSTEAKMASTSYGGWPMDRTPRSRVAVGLHWRSAMNRETR